MAAVVTTLVLALPATASARPVAHPNGIRPAADVRAMQAGGLAKWLENVGLNWARRFAKRTAKEIGDTALTSAETWVVSGGTECDFPFPQKFCSSRARASSQRPIWGLGTALSINGVPPGVWNRVVTPRFHDAYGLVPGTPYWLTCWAHGDWITRLDGSRTNLWYRLTQGGYVSDVFVYTGTNHRIPGVAHCRR